MWNIIVELNKDSILYDLELNKVLQCFFTYSGVTKSITFLKKKKVDAAKNDTLCCVLTDVSMIIPSRNF